MKTEYEVTQAVEIYADMVWRICLYHLKNKADAEDVFQNVFLKYMLYEAPFESVKHEKAWLIRVSINACRDLQRTLFRHPTKPLELLQETAATMPENEREILNVVLSLPAKYKDVIYLHYYEGYSAKEIGQILKKKENTIYSLLSRGRDMLRAELGGEGFDQ